MRLWAAAAGACTTDAKTSLRQPGVHGSGTGTQHRSRHLQVAARNLRLKRSACAQLPHKGATTMHICIVNAWNFNLVLASHRILECRSNLQ
jgi:hypothetical protein